MFYACKRLAAKYPNMLVALAGLWIIIAAAALSLYAKVCVIGVKYKVPDLINESLESLHQDWGILDPIIIAMYVVGTGAILAAALNRRRMR